MNFPIPDNPEPIEQVPFRAPLTVDQKPALASVTLIVVGLICASTAAGLQWGFPAGLGLFGTGLCIAGWAIS